MTFFFQWTTVVGKGMFEKGVRSSLPPLLTSFFPTRIKDRLGTPALDLKALPQRRRKGDLHVEERNIYPWMGLVGLPYVEFRKKRICAVLSGSCLVKNLFHHS